MFAGYVANFTLSTNNYAVRDKQRPVFIAAHLHILIVAWLLGIGFWNAILVWGYTIAGAFAVNAFKDSQFQKFIPVILFLLTSVKREWGLGLRRAMPMQGESRFLQSRT